MNEQTPFQRWLNTWLEEAHWSAATLAAEVGVSAAAVGRWRRAEAMPGRDNVPALASVTGVRTEFLQRLMLNKGEEEATARTVADYLTYQLPNRFTLAEARRLVLLAQTLREWDDEMLREARARLGVVTTPASNEHTQES